MAKILVLNGPNLNLLGARETQHYGFSELNKINEMLVAAASEKKLELTCFQSNAEHELIEHIHVSLPQGIKFIIINPAAFTHTSIALRDALLAVAIPFIEVHLSNIYRREPFRHISYFSDIAEGIIAGFGPQGYLFALEAAEQYLQTNTG